MQLESDMKRLELKAPEKLEIEIELLKKENQLMKSENEDLKRELEITENLDSSLTDSLIQIFYEDSESQTKLVHIYQNLCSLVLH